MARKANYDDKIKTLEEKIEKKKAEIKALKEQLDNLKSKKSKDGYQELMEYMKTNNLSADEVLKKIKK
jgi:flagellar biosynthesis chaperone FliJ